MKKKFLNNIDTLLKVLDIVILFVLVISFTFVGQVDFEEIEISSNPYEIVLTMFTILGALLCGISIHFILSGFIEIKYMGTQKRLEKQLEKLEKNIVNSVSGVRKIVFDDMNDVDEYLANRILEAQKSVYDLNWKDIKWPYRTVHRDEVKMGLMAKKLDDAIKKKCRDGLIIKQIFTLADPKNIEKIRRRVTYGESYSCSVYLKEDLSINNFPKLTFAIIDDEEVIFTSSEYRYYCAIKDEKLISILENYFDQAWEFSTKIKENKTIHENILKKSLDKEYSKEI